MVDFVCDEEGSPILAISSLAAHTKVGFFFSFLTAQSPVSSLASLISEIHFCLQVSW